MTREAILKELELWPLWTLKQPFPTLHAAADTIEETNLVHSEQIDHVAEIALTLSEKLDAEHDLDHIADLKEHSVGTPIQDERADESIATYASIDEDAFVMATPSAITNTPSVQFQLFASAEGHCLMVHDNAPFNESQSLLWQNICQAMRLNMTFVAENVDVSALLTGRAPKVMMLFGETIAHTILGDTREISLLRQQKLHHQTIPCVVSFDLQHLLLHGQDKAKAWADLCTVLAILKGEQ